MKENDLSKGVEKESEDALKTTEVFDNFSIDKDDDDAIFKRILASAKKRGEEEQSQPPASLMMELKGKLKERRTKLVESDPVTFKVFDSDRSQFIATSK